MHGSRFHRESSPSQRSGGNSRFVRDALSGIRQHISIGISIVKRIAVENHCVTGSLLAGAYCGGEGLADGTCAAEIKWRQIDLLGPCANWKLASGISCLTIP
jgi:hypothetical protein